MVKWIYNLPGVNHYYANSTIRFREIATLSMNQYKCTAEGDQVQLLPCRTIALVSCSLETDVAEQSENSLNMFELNNGNWEFHDTIYSCENGLMSIIFRLSDDGKTLAVACPGYIE